MTDHVIENAPPQGSHPATQDMAGAVPGPRRRRLRFPAVAAVLVGRYVVLVWLPVLVWLITAMVERLRALSWDGNGFYVSTDASSLFVVMVHVSVAVMWLGTTGLALALGHPRGRVFLVATVFSTVMVAASQFLVEVAHRVEFAVSGEMGPRVLAIRIPAGYEVMPSPLLDGVVSQVALNQLMWLPLPMAVVMACCWILRWRWLGLVGGIATGLVLFVGHLFLFSVVVEFARGPRQYVAAQGLAFLISMTAILGLAWLAFRRRPV